MEGFGALAATHGSSLGAFVILCMALYKGMRMQQLKGALMETAKLTVMIFTIIWVILFGWEIAIAHLLGGVILAITIVGIPFAKQHFKLIPVALFPFIYDLD